MLLNRYGPSVRSRKAFAKRREMAETERGPGKCWSEWQDLNLRTPRPERLGKPRLPRSGSKRLSRLKLETKREGPAMTRNQIQTGDEPLGGPQGWFTRFANAVGRLTAQPATFLTAMAVVTAWAAAGPFFGFGTTWQLAINTSTTIVTFLMVFLIQNTQYRDTLALQVKLSELILVIEGADKRIAIAEHLPEDEICRVRDAHRAQSGNVTVDEAHKSADRPEKSAL